MEQLEERLEALDFPNMALLVSSMLGDEGACTVKGNDRNRLQTPGSAADSMQPSTVMSACNEGMLVFGTNVNLTRLSSDIIQYAANSNTSANENNGSLDLAIVSSPYIDECSHLGGKILDYDALTTCTTPKLGNFLNFTMKHIPMCVPLVCTLAELQDQLDRVILPAMADLNKVLIPDATCTVRSDNQTHLQGSSLGAAANNESKVSSSTVFAWLTGMVIVSLLTTFVVYQYWFFRRRAFKSSSRKTTTDEQREYELVAQKPVDV